MNDRILFVPLSRRAGAAIGLGLAFGLLSWGWTPPVQALQSEAGEALLVPYAICEAGSSDLFPLQDTVVMIGVSGNAAPGANAHWFFYDESGEFLGGHGIPVTANGLIPFSLCKAGSELGAMDGKAGYLVITDEAAADNSGAGFRMTGEAKLVEAAIGSVASIPVLPLWDGAGRTDPDDAQSAIIDPEGTATGSRNEVVYDAAGKPVRVVPWFAGSKMNNQNQIKDNYILSIPYFLVNTLTEKNQFVFWFDRNCSEEADGCNRNIVQTDVYDTAANFRGDDLLSLPKQLNIRSFEAAPPVKEFVNGRCLPIQPSPEFPRGWLAGMLNGGPEVQPDADSGTIWCINNAGLVFFKIPEALHGFEGASVAEDVAATPTTPGYYTAGIGFNLIFRNQDFDNMVETQFAQERGFDF